jgi:hypothetical protein
MEGAFLEVPYYIILPPPVISHSPPPNTYPNQRCFQTPSDEVLNLTSLHQTMSHKICQFDFIEIEPHVKESQDNSHTEDHRLSFSITPSLSLPFTSPLFSIYNPSIRIRAHCYGLSARYPEHRILSVSLTLLGSFQRSDCNN